MDHEKHRQEVELLKATEPGNRRTHRIPERYGTQAEADRVRLAEDAGLGK